jgi:uracil-DNA glycosylase
MNMGKAKIDYSAEREIVLKQIMERSGIDFERELENIFKQLKPLDESSNPIKVKNEPKFVPPYFGKDDIKLIIIGQDPTIRNEERRKNITCTLNLDKAGALTKYVKQICEGLGITIENVYATNVFKYFYSEPPAKTFDVLKNHLEPNLCLLNKELSVFPNIPVITLGEPVLRLLSNNDKDKVREYWGYDPRTGISNEEYKFVSANENKLGRTLFPFCHQPSIRKQFYKNTLVDYINHVKRESEL